MIGERFSRLSEQSDISMLLVGRRNYKVILRDMNSITPKIPLNASLVLIGITDKLDVHKVVQTGYTIPHKVNFGPAIGPDSNIYLEGFEKFNGDAPFKFEKFNGDAPFKHASRVLFIQSDSSPTSGILKATANESFTAGRFEGTEFKEYNIVANKRFYGIAEKDENSADYTVERTLNGYFKVNFAKPLAGLHYIRIGGPYRRGQVGTGPTNFEAIVEFEGLDDDESIDDGPTPGSAPVSEAAVPSPSDSQVEQSRQLREGMALHRKYEYRKAFDVWSALEEKAKRDGNKFSHAAGIFALVARAYVDVGEGRVPGENWPALSLRVRRIQQNAIPEVATFARELEAKLFRETVNEKHFRDAVDLFRRDSPEEAEKELKKITEDSAYFPRIAKLREGRGR